MTDVIDATLLKSALIKNLVTGSKSLDNQEKSTIVGECFKKISLLDLIFSMAKESDNSLLKFLFRHVRRHGVGRGMVISLESDGDCSIICQCCLMLEDTNLRSKGDLRIGRRYFGRNSRSSARHKLSLVFMFILANYRIVGAQDTKSVQLRDVSCLAEAPESLRFDLQVEAGLGPGSLQPDLQVRAGPGDRVFYWSMDPWTEKRGVITSPSIRFTGSLKLAEPLTLTCISDLTDSSTASTAVFTTKVDFGIDSLCMTAVRDQWMCDSWETELILIERRLPCIMVCIDPPWQRLVAPNGVVERSDDMVYTRHVLNTYCYRYSQMGPKDDGLGSFNPYGNAQLSSLDRLNPVFVQASSVDYSRYFFGQVCEHTLGITPVYEFRIVGQDIQACIKIRGYYGPWSPSCATADLARECAINEFFLRAFNTLKPFYIESDGVPPSRVTLPVQLSDQSLSLSKQSLKAYAVQHQLGEPQYFSEPTRDGIVSPVWRCVVVVGLDSWTTYSPSQWKAELMAAQKAINYYTASAKDGGHGGFNPYGNGQTTFQRKQISENQYEEACLQKQVYMKSLTGSIQLELAIRIHRSGARSSLWRVQAAAGNMVVMQTGFIRNLLILQVLESLEKKIFDQCNDKLQRELLDQSKEKLQGY